MAFIGMLPKDGERRPPSPMLVAAAVSMSLLGDALSYAVLPSQALSSGVPLALVGILLGHQPYYPTYHQQLRELRGRRPQSPGQEGPLSAAMVRGTMTTLSYAFPWRFWVLLAARMI